MRVDGWCCWVVLVVGVALFDSIACGTRADVDQIGNRRAVVVSRWARTFDGLRVRRAPGDQLVVAARTRPWRTLGRGGALGPGRDSLLLRAPRPGGDARVPGAAR